MWETLTCTELYVNYISINVEKSNYTYLPTVQPLACTPDTNMPLNTAHIPTQAPHAHTQHISIHILYTLRPLTLYTSHIQHAHTHNTARTYNIQHFCVCNSNFLSYLSNRPWKPVHRELQYRPYLRAATERVKAVSKRVSGRSWWEAPTSPFSHTVPTHCINNFFQILKSTIHFKRV